MSVSVGSVAARSSGSRHLTEVWVAGLGMGRNCVGRGRVARGEKGSPTCSQLKLRVSPGKTCFLYQIHGLNDE